MEVIVLCGGLGTRLRPVLPECPKCMAPVAGKPFLHYLLRWLSEAGAGHVVFSVGYLREQVMAYVRAGDWAFRTDFAVEETPLGTGGGIRLALSLCTEETVFVVNGDTFFPVPLAEMPADAPISLSLKPMRNFSRYGAVETEGGRVRAFREKTPCAEGCINGGVYRLRPALIDWTVLPEKFSFEKEVLQPMAAAGQVAGWVSDRYFIDIGIPEDYARAQRELPEWQALADVSASLLAARADTLFLDRDGVVNRLIPGDYVRTPEQFRFLPGMPETLALWAGKFRRIVMVTNQRGVGRGLMTDADLARIHAGMMSAILAAGGRIDLLLACTSADEQDPRRKPNPGMFREACALFPEIRAEESIMLGDSASDAAFAAACGMPFILLKVPEAASWDSWERPV